MAEMSGTFQKKHLRQNTKEYVEGIRSELNEMFQAEPIEETEKSRHKFGPDRGEVRCFCAKRNKRCKLAQLFSKKEGRIVLNALYLAF